MSKYDPLIDHLRALPVDKVRLGFSAIEKMLNVRLPESARKHREWWANSRVGETHKWAQEWQAVGWKVVNVSFAAGFVDFERSNEPPPVPSALDLLAPTKRAFILDLVQQAGINIDDWSYKTNGELVEKPRANPQFCYDWAFGNEREGYVLCLWHKSLNDPLNQIVLQSNPAAHTQELRRLIARRETTPTQRQRLIQQLRRSEAYEAAIQFSYLRARPLRVIINIGEMRQRDELADRKAAVWRRSLDSEFWYVHRINSDGDTLIVRGVPPTSMSDGDYPDAGDSPDGDSPGADDLVREGTIRQRRGQAKFRAMLLAAYSRRCAVTGSTVEALLEAAHIVPHSEGTNYRASNGLLLRADIHTLYDLYLLSIDAGMQIHLSKQVLDPYYKGFNKKRLEVFPNKPSEQASAANLERRHSRFLEKEANRI